MDQGLGLHLDPVRDQRESGLVDLTSHLQQLHLMPGAASGQLTGATPASPGMFPNMLQFPGQLATPLFMHPQAMTQQATRHARLVYVSGLPPTANEQSVATFFSQVMAAIGGNSDGPGDAVINVYINHEKKFSFVEMRSVQEASNAMALDGIIFEGAQVKVSRPSDYNHSLAAELGPSQPNPNLNLAAVGLTPGSGGGLEGPDRIFVGGLPYYFTEAKIRELLESFGTLRGFDLVKDRETGNSKGYAFCVYQDLSVTDIVCASLNGIKMGDKTLTVRRANQGAWQQKLEQESMLLQSLLKLEQESRLLHAQRQVALQDAPVNVRRPSDFNPSLAEALGPCQPYPNLNLAAVGLTPGSAGGLEAPDLIYVGGLPFYVTEAQIRELLEFFGPLRGFDLVKDRKTGNSKGYAFCVYQDLSVTDIVCAGLNGIKMGDKTLIVRRASQGAWQLKYEQESAQQQRLLQGGALPTKVISLTQVVSADELMDDDEYEDILEDMSTEGRKYGNLVNVVIPRPGPNGELSPGVGKVFLEYTDTDGATIARQGLHGRVFGGNLVTANFYAEDKFSQGDYNG